ncbi:MAG: hypothetical protein EBT20_18575 [Alphaproteobacteria bacterium]|nr:hypothetical protein [Paracoccaceae bacterium]NBT42437.1 hypothetical protein [Alphaproteobacteria bacterium]
MVEGAPLLNAVEIHAPLSEVCAYLAPDYFMGNPNRPIYRFNLHKLYPDHFWEVDPCCHTSWNYNWMTENMGAKWTPNVSIQECEPGVSVLDYTTEWLPNNRHLERLLFFGLSKDKSQGRTSSYFDRVIKINLEGS